MCPGDQRGGCGEWTLGTSAAAGRAACLESGRGFSSATGPAAEVAAWWAALARAAEAETGFLAVLGFIAVGRKR